MTRPGDRLLRLAQRICSERTRRRLIEPAIADLQAETASARPGSRWLAARTHTLGYASVAKVMAIAACGDLLHEATSWRPEERAGVWRGARTALAATIAATIAWEANVMSDVRWMVTESSDGSGWAGLFTQAVMGVYLAPSTLVLTLPLGLVLFVAMTFQGTARTAKLAIATITLAMLCSAAMFANVAWVTPEANQAFRQITFSRLQPGTVLARGDNELTLSVVRARLKAARELGVADDVRLLERLYHQKLAIASAALPMVGLLLALAFRHNFSRARLTLVAAGLCLTYYAGLELTTGASALGVPPIVAAWWTNGVCATMAIALTWRRSQAQRQA
jgi:hypothetical protein